MLSENAGNYSSHMAPVPEVDSPNKKAGVGKHTAVSVSLLHPSHLWGIPTALRLML